MNTATAENKIMHIISAQNFYKIPGNPIAYWVSQAVSDVFRMGNSLGDIAQPRVGLQTNDNEKYLRFWYEPNYMNIERGCVSYVDSLNSERKWYGHNKGGKYRKWYGNIIYVIEYRHNGTVLRSDPKAAVIPDMLVFKEQLSYSRLGGERLSMRWFPAGMIFDSAAVVAFPRYNESLYILGVMNSKIISRLISAIAPTTNTQPGDISKIPIVVSDELNDKLVAECVQLAKKDWDSFETSWDFRKHPLV